MKEEGKITKAWDERFEAVYPWKGMMPIIEVSGGPYNIGFDYARQCRPIVQRVAQAFIDMLSSATQTIRGEILEECQRYETAIRRTLGTEYIDEMHGIASGAAVEYETILALNCGWDLLNSLPTPESHPDYMCSSFAAWGTATRDGTVICGHNDDGARYIDQFLVLLHAHPKNGNDFIVPLVPGYIGYHRMWNDQGVVLFGLALEDGCTNDSFDHNVPMWVLLRFLTQYGMCARDVTKKLHVYPPATAFNFLFVDRTGNGRIVEATASRQVDIIPQAACSDIVLTNHALDESIKAELVLRDHPSSTDYRYETVSMLINQARGNIGLNTAKEILSSHYDVSKGRTYPSLNSPCRHGEYVGKLTGTVSSTVLELTDEAIHAEVSLGNPCEGRWTEIVLPIRTS